MSINSQQAIFRSIYIDKVKPFMGKNLIKCFTGQRRVGKSFLLYQIMAMVRQESPNDKILYINKEDLSYNFIKTAEDLNQFVLQNKSENQKTYVFIDEIQDIQDFEMALRSLLLNPNLDIYITGSNANLLSGDIAGYLSGRAIEITVYSLSYQEFLLFHQLDDSKESLDRFLKYGGLPYLKHLPFDEPIIFEYLKNIYSTIIFRDVIHRFAVRNTLFLEQLVYFLASNTGSIFSSKKISDYLKSQRVNIASNQVQLYTSYLSSAYLVHQLKRYDIDGKRIFEIGEKYYFENLGIRNALWGYRLEDRGKIMENAVCNHLLVQGYKVEVGVLGDNEIDFIGVKKGEKIYIQVALSLSEEKTMDREFGNLKKIKDNYPKIVVTMDAFSGNTVEGIKIIDLRSFLNNRWH